MVKWCKLFGNQYLGFWALGLALFALQELPYLLMPLFHLESNPIMAMPETSAALDACEKVLGSLCIAELVFLVHGEAVFFRAGPAMYAAAAILLLNYIGWGLYFAGFQSVGHMLFFLVALPPLYYACLGLWRRNWALLVTGLAFAAVHILHVGKNFLHFQV